jgi:hypothetical protein
MHGTSRAIVMLVVVACAFSGYQTFCLEGGGRYRTPAYSTRMWSALTAGHINTLTYQIYQRVEQPPGTYG